MVLQPLRNWAYRSLRRSESFFKTDMVYLAKGGLWLTLGQVISSLSAFLLSLAFANLLPKEVYGNYRYILSICALLSIPTLSGMTTAVAQAVARGFDGTLTEALRIRIKWGSLSAIASIIIAFYYWHNANAVLAFSFLITAIFLPFFETLGMYDSLLIGKKKFEVSTRYNIATRLIATAVMIAALLLSKNLFIILLAYFIVYTILKLVFLRLSLKFRSNNEISHEAISYGKHLSLIEILSTITGNIDRILSFHLLGAVELATYSFATAPADQINSGFKNFTSIAIPKLAEKDTRAIRHSFYGRFFMLLLIGLGIAALYAIAAPYIYHVFFPQYTDAIGLSQLYALVIALRVPYNFIDSATRAKINIIPKAWLYWGVPSHFIFLISLYFLTIYLGLAGIILSRIIFVICAIATGLIRWYFLFRKYEN